MRITPRTEAPVISITERYPRPRLDKLGVQPGQRVTLLGVNDDEFRDELLKRGAAVTHRLRKDSDLIFLRATSSAALGRLKGAKASLRSAGAVWVLWPKGRPGFTEDHVRAVALATGLVDVKVVSFSDILSGLKLVIRLADRPKREGAS